MYGDCITSILVLFLNDDVYFVLQGQVWLLNASESYSSWYLVFVINKCLTITECLLCVYNIGVMQGKHWLQRFAIVV